MLRRTSETGHLNCGNFFNFQNFPDALKIRINIEKGSSLLPNIVFSCMPFKQKFIP